MLMTLLMRFKSAIRAGSPRYLMILCFMLLSASVQAQTALIWLAEEREGRRDLASVAHPVVNEIRSQLPESIALLTPLMDLRDQQIIDADVLWQGDQRTIFEASERYSVDHILVARVMEEGSRPMIEWLIWLSGERHTLSTEGEWSTHAADVTEFLAQHSSSPVDMASIDAEPLALAPMSGLQGTQVLIFGLHQATDFLDAMEILHEQFGHSAIRMISFNSGVLRVTINYDGATSGLRRELSGQPRLDSRSNERLEFTWN